MKRLQFCLLLSLIVASGRVFAIEPWADASLPVKKDLLLWLDAGNLIEAHQSLHRKTLASENPVATWFDASGNKLDLRQDDLKLAPKLLTIGNDAIVRFDGEDDYYRLTQTGQSLESFSIFIVASPRRNQGSFRGILAFNAPGEKDYTSGLNLDLGPQSSPRFSMLNLEGKGFSGAQNLLQAEEPFGKLHIIEIAGAQNQIEVTLDGAKQGNRARAPGALSLDEIILGARFYNNEAGPQKAQGFGAFDVAEVLVYRSALTETDAASVRAYLKKKHEALAASLPPDTTALQTKRLEPIKNAPAAQFFLPGFEVRELPLDLTNINNIRCRPDGTLVALGYDGNIWLLRDRDGDGLEETAEPFWENKGQLISPIGAALTPPGYKLGFGLFVAGKNKVSLVLDRNGDDKADEEIVVATGWTPLIHSVDALGLAVDPKDQSIYFGLGTTDFTNAYQVGADGKAKYSLDSERGTILRIAPDFKSREIICTGTRFTIGMAFDKHGELFVTDQEGATWLPNGNPFDELLHIQKGKHYGFPPRHPKHLPNVIDEPSTFDFRPQHQSNCGLAFNEPILEGDPTFGPASWRGDAFSVGYSRGKLYRTALSKSDAGYVAQTQLLASLKMLTADLCFTRQGDMILACHSGGPDWGSGPAGKGKLFKVRYADKSHPQPVFAWPASPSEIRVEFDRPVRPELLRDVVAKSSLTAGAYVGAGDRYETLWPGYAVVEMQKDAPRREISIHSAQLTPDGRTLLLATDRQIVADQYALTLPGMDRIFRKPDAGPLRNQDAVIDLAYDLTGCEASWRSTGSDFHWQGWLPHPDLEVSRKLTAGSAPHQALWKAMDLGQGTLQLSFQLKLDNMLRPAVQPGSTLDYEQPQEEIAISISSTERFRFVANGKELLTKRLTPQGLDHSIAVLSPTDKKILLCKLNLAWKDESSRLEVTWFTSEDKTPRRLPLSRVYLPWANLDRDPKAELKTLARAKELEGGSWARGRKIFHGEQGKCAKCHSIGGQGAAVGPDLTNLVHRDYASVLRDIAQPSFAINPDYTAAVYSLNDGRVLTGVVRTEGGKLRLGDKEGAFTEFAADQIESTQASKISIMPDGLAKELGPERMRDLLTYLLTPPPSMPRDAELPRPAPRQKSEVLSLLAGAPEKIDASKKLKIILVAGAKDHGPGEHDYPAWQKAWAELLSAADNVEVETAWEWPDKKQFAEADVLVFFQHGTWNNERAADLDPFLARGGGAVYIHWAVDGNPQSEDFAARIGLASKLIKFRHGPLDVEFNRAISHPIARNFTRLQLVDESYWQMTGDLPADRVIAASREEGAPQPIFWTLEKGKGRIFVSIPGHYSWSFDDPAFRLLLLRGIAWSAKEDVDRLSDLIWPGADIAK